MQIEKTFIDGVLKIKYNCFSDLRGELIKPFVADNILNFEAGCNLNFKEIWFTKSKKNVIRAMHMQTGLNASEKFVAVINGHIVDVVLDLRKDSPTYGKYLEQEIKDTDGIALYIPVGCAHGYKVCTDDSVVMYAAPQNHSAKDDVGVRWDSFGYDWNVEEPIISARDLELKNF